MKQFDVIVVGSGPGGYQSARLLIEAGKRVALIEKSLFGGVCLNAGCIPKEGLYHLALKDNKPNWEVAIERLWRKVAEIRESSLRELIKKGLIYIEGEGRLVDRNVIKVNGQTYKAEYIILACGSRPKDEGLTPEDILSGRFIPRGRVVVVGGGASGCELAFILRSFGFPVTLLYKEGLLHNYHNIPEEFINKLETKLEEVGVSLADKIDTLQGDVLIYATGRVPNHVQSDHPLISFDKKGFLVCNSFLQATTDNIFVAGDLLQPMGAGYAFEKARVAVENILQGGAEIFEPLLVPVVISSAYEIGFVGDIKRVKTFVTKPLSINPLCYVTDNKGLIKLGFDEDGKLIYFAILGRGVREMLNMVSLIIKVGVESLGSFAHPSVCEIINQITTIKKEALT